MTTIIVGLQNGTVRVQDQGEVIEIELLSNVSARAKATTEEIASLGWQLLALADSRRAAARIAARAVGG